MKIINKIDDERNKKWIGQLVEYAIEQAQIKCEKVVIDFFDENNTKIIFTDIDGTDYHIRLLDFQPVERDENDDVCAADIKYTLIKMIPDDIGAYGVSDSETTIRIAWKN